MTRISRVRVFRIGAISAILLIAAARGSAAQGSKIDVSKLETFKHIKDGLKKIKDANDLGEKLEKLSPDDDQYEPDYKLPGTPELPSLCKDSQKCEACFKQPYADFQNTRIRFEKLRRLNRVTKDMLRDAISFGDAAASAAGGLAPLVWDKEKTKIRESEKTFNSTYDAKYEELLATLKDNLLGIAACEEKIFGNESWFDRFGFMYQQFMAVAYRRPD
jgi:hypothetical protein